MKINTTLITAEIVRRLPALVADSAVNAETVINNILEEHLKDRVLECVQGETLRDKFAAAAMSGLAKSQEMLLANKDLLEEFGTDGIDRLQASKAYRLADSMMEQRKK
jgi:hypothetical protein